MLAIEIERWWLLHARIHRTLYRYSLRHDLIVEASKHLGAAPGPVVPDVSTVSEWWMRAEADFRVHRENREIFSMVMSDPDLANVDPGRDATTETCSTPSLPVWEIRIRPGGSPCSHPSASYLIYRVPVRSDPSRAAIEYAAAVVNE